MDAVARWERMWRELGSSAPDGLLAQLRQAYREPQRHYHTLQHLDECLLLADALRPEMQRPAELELALWFHDAVYDVHAHDNEARSARWAATVMLDAGLDADAATRVTELIMATCHAAPASSPDAAILTDIDLAILGADPPRFAEYEHQIRAEYAHVAPAVFAAKRRAILQGFLDRPQIYATDTMRARLEAPARRNLAQAIVSG